MSRIGKLPVEIPSGVKATIGAGQVTIEGPVGKLDYSLGRGVEVKQEDNNLVVSCLEESQQALSNFGTTRSHLNNMVHGVTKGWRRELIFSGTGYGAELQGQTLVVKVGLSHDVKFELPAQLKCIVGKGTVALESCSKQIVGDYAARIRKVRPPEPYLGKGIRYANEVVRRKVGKAAK